MWPDDNPQMLLEYFWIELPIDISLTCSNADEASTQNSNRKG